MVDELFQVIQPAPTPGKKSTPAPNWEAYPGKLGQMVTASLPMRGLEMVKVMPMAQLPPTFNVESGTEVAIWIG